MTDSIANMAKQGGGITVARMKFGKPSVQAEGGNLTRAEKQLSDIINIGSAARERVEKARKLDGYMRLFNSVLHYFNGTSSTALASSIQTVEIEYITLENPYLKKTDTIV